MAGFCTTEAADCDGGVLTAAAAAVAYRTGSEAGGRDGIPFFTILDIGCEPKFGGGLGAIYYS